VKNPDVDVDPDPDDDPDEAPDDDEVEDIEEELENAEENHDEDEDDEDDEVEPVALVQVVWLFCAADILSMVNNSVVLKTVLVPCPRSCGPMSHSGYYCIKLSEVI